MLADRRFKFKSQAHLRAVVFTTVISLVCGRSFADEHGIGDVGVSRCMALLAGGDNSPDAFAKAYFAILPSDISLAALDALIKNPLSSPHWNDGVSAVNQGSAFEVLKSHLLGLPVGERHEKLDRVVERLKELRDRVRPSLPNQVSPRSRTILAYKDPFVIKISEDQKTLIAFNRERTFLIDIQSGRQIFNQYKFLDGIRNAALSPNGRYLVQHYQGDPEGLITLTDLQNGITNQTFKFINSALITHLEFSKGGALIFARGITKSFVLNLSLEPLYETPSDSKVMAWAHLENTLRMILRYGTGQAFIVNLTNLMVNEVVQVLPSKLATLSADGSKYATAPYNVETPVADISVYDVSSNNQLASMTLTSHTATSQLAFLKHQDSLYRKSDFDDSGSRLEIWDSQTGELRFSHHVPIDMMTESIDHSQDGRFLGVLFRDNGTVGSPTHLELFDLYSGRKLDDISDVRSFQFSARELVISQVVSKDRSEVRVISLLRYEDQQP